LTSRKKHRTGLLWRAAVVAALLALTAAVWYFDAVSYPTDWLVDDTRYREEIAEAAGRHGIDPELVRALIFQESRFNARARGSRGEIGLMQVLPRGAAAEWARVRKRPKPSMRELFEVRTNLDIGCWYLARALRRWRGYDARMELALAQYNAGETRAKAWAPARKDGTVVERITVASTKKYVTRIMKRYRRYVARRGECAAAR